jgi:hypothetical protein
VKKKRLSVQITEVLRQADQEIPAIELCRKLGIASLRRCAVGGTASLGPCLAEISES